MRTIYRIEVMQSYQFVYLCWGMVACIILSSIMLLLSINFLPLGFWLLEGIWLQWFQWLTSLIILLIFGYLAWQISRDYLVQTPSVFVLIDLQYCLIEKTRYKLQLGSFYLDNWIILNLEDENFNLHKRRIVLSPNMISKADCSRLRRALKLKKYLNTEH